MLLRTLAAAGLGLAPLMTAAPVKSRYRIDQTIEQVVDASAMGQGQEHQRFSVSTFVTVALSDTTGGKTVHAIVDSINADTAARVPQAVLDSARGVALHGFVAGDGRLRDVKPLRETPLAPQMVNLVRQLFPAVRPGVKQGDGWADTTETTSPAAGGAMTVRRVTTYKASGTETRSGTKALKIDAAFTATVNGTQQTSGGPATIEGTGSGTESYYLAPDGHYIGGTSQQSSKLTVAGNFAPKPVPISLTETITVSELR